MHNLFILLLITHNLYYVKCQLNDVSLPIAYCMNNYIYLMLAYWLHVVCKLIVYRLFTFMQHAMNGLFTIICVNGLLIIRVCSLIMLIGC